MAEVALDLCAPLTDDEKATAAPIAAAEPQIEIIMPVPSNAPSPSFRHVRHGESSAVWTYRDADGAALLHVCRYNKPDGGKEFAPRAWGRLPTGATAWYWKMPPANRPLYGLDRLAKSPSASVVICEGEKATDAAAKVFLKSVTMCWAGGSNAVAKTDFSPLAGRKVLLWPDNDGPGLKAMEQVASILADLNCEVSAIDSSKAAAMVPDQLETQREPVATWDAADAVAEWSKLGELRKALFGLAERKEAPAKYLSFDDFRMSADGLTVTAVKGRGDTAKEVEEWVSAAFEIIGRVRDPESNGWAKLLRWQDEDGKTHSHSVADALVHGDAKVFVSELASRGLNIRRGGGSQLADYLNRAKVDRRVTTVGRTGWHEVGGKQVFVLPAETIGSSAAETVILAGANSAPFEAKGYLSGWQAGVGALVQNHHRHVFAVASAFAGPLLALVKQDGGGFNFHGGSSTGKSTAIEAAASVWGRGSSPGYVRSWRATANAIEAAAALHTDTALVLDELGVVDAREAGAAAYQLAAGSGKGRSARDGSLRTPLTWRTLILSTGEIRLADKLTEGKQRAMAGQAVRLVDIPADAGKGFGSFDHSGPTGNAKDIADSIKRAARTAYGTAGPEFVRRLISEGLEEVSSLALGSVDAFRSTMVPRGADGQVQRAADRFGLVAAAGEIAASLGVVPWPAGSAKRAAEVCFLAWMESRGGSEAHEVREAVERVRAFVQAHGDSRFEPLPKMLESRPIPNRVGYRRGEGGDREWLIFPEAWKAEVVAGLDPKAAASALSDRCMLRRANDGFQRVEKIDGKPTRFYVVTAEILTSQPTGELHVAAES
ncbi:MAG: DUF927 domain-containing protein [Ancalomicrobiaceae bacterium]|nr:DUF927 domain-containing protein [Ancalomicrobiaceae bacterium]